MGSLTPTATVPTEQQFVSKEAASGVVNSFNGASIHFSLDNEDLLIKCEIAGDRDMFQLGRARASNDIVIDIPSVSRQACRVIINRSEPHEAKIYASGFDKTNRIILPQHVTKAEVNGSWDALTTNGVMILHPPHRNGMMHVSLQEICDWEPRWREVSVMGKLYHSNADKSTPNMIADLVNDEDNVLLDGTLVDIAGVILMWRTTEACERFNDDALQQNIEKLNISHNICPVMFQTLMFPKDQNDQVDEEKDFHAFLTCGHVYSGNKNIAGLSQCGLCKMKVSENDNRLVKLRLGFEPYLSTDGELPSWFFRDCGHVVSEKTAKYWSRINFTDGKRCPFCFKKLLSPPIAQLFYQQQ